MEELVQPTEDVVSPDTWQLPTPYPWLAHYSRGVPAELPLPAQSLPQLLEAAAGRHGTRDALIFYGTRMTYVRLVALIERFAQALQRLGVQRGDRVSLMLPNVPQFPIAFFGALKAGAIVVATNPTYTQPELRHQLQDAGVTVVVTLDQLYPTLAAVRAETPVRHVVLARVADYLPPLLALGYQLRRRREARHEPRVDPRVIAGDRTIHQFKDLVARGTAGKRSMELFALPAPAQPDDLAVIQYTGGTTGLAKGAMLTHRNLAINAMQTFAWSESPSNSHQTMLCVAPFFHSYGLTVGMNSTLLSSGTMVLLPRFVVKDVIRAIERYKPQQFPGVPTMYVAINHAMQKHKADLSSIKVCISGAAPLPAAVQSTFEQLTGGKLVEGYGMTETSPVTHCNPVYGERRPGTIGLPVPNTVAAIIDPATWKLLPAGEIGEIVIKGPQVMQGYWNRPDATAEQIREGWIRTGDIGLMDADGYFKIVDRAKDLIIAGGYNIYPRDVEEVLFAHPAVQDACVIGVPDEYRGETVRAYVVVKPGQTLTADELTAYCKEQLAPYKVPKQIVFRESLPKTLIGKVLRRALRDEALAELAAQSNMSSGS
jgi:long-chain acyl-CoA synthetase